jgi:tripartite-type tricarboxylate transporter receptor subunit TctC
VAQARSLFKNKSLRKRRRPVCFPVSLSGPGEAMLPRVAAVCLLSLIAALSGFAAAESGFPNRPVKFLVPFPGGGINDVLARIVADKLQAKWGQPVVVENRTGAGGNIGAEVAAQAEPDGYTLFVSAPGPLATNPILYRNLSYRAQDFVPITLLGAVPNLLIVRKELPPHTVGEFIDYVKHNPGKVTYGSQGIGATPHLTGQMFMNMTGTQMVHVPYRGETLVLNDMLGGHVDVFFGNLSSALALYRQGRVKVLAVTDKARAPAIPEVPTTAEAGLPGLLSFGWFAMAGPPRMSAALQSEIAAATIDVLQMPDVRQKFRAVAVEPVGSGPAAMAAFLKEEIGRWGEVIRKNNIVLE